LITVRKIDKKKREKKEKKEGGTEREKKKRKHFPLLHSFPFSCTTAFIVNTVIRKVTSLSLLYIYNERVVITSPHNFFYTVILIHLAR
jgi:hypothetical protein